MKKAKIMSFVIVVVGVLLISIGMMIQNGDKIQELNSNKVDLNDMAASANMVFKENTKSDNKNDNNIDNITDNVTNTTNNNENNNNNNSNSNDTSALFREVSLDAAPASIIIPPRIEVFEGMTMEELAAKLDRNLGNDYIAGKGYLIAAQCLEKGVDPYIAVAIMLHETGCRYSCSGLTRSCNNVGGQKGAPGCNGGSYKAFATLDEGIIGFIDNLSRNYFQRGLTTIEQIGPRYAESNTWVSKIHSYVNQIRAS